MNDYQFRFVVVYELPKARLLPGIQRVEFVQVDWFSCLALPNANAEVLTRHIKAQGYYRPKRRFLVLDRDTGMAFTIAPEDPDAEKRPA